MADDRVDMGWRAIGAFLKKWRQKRRKNQRAFDRMGNERLIWILHSAFKG